MGPCKLFSATQNSRIVPARISVFKCPKILLFTQFNLSYLYKAENMRIGLGGAYDAAQTYLLQTLYPSFCPNGRLAVLPDNETASKGGLH